MVTWMGISPSKYHDWKQRYGRAPAARVQPPPTLAPQANSPPREEVSLTPLFLNSLFFRPDGTILLVSWWFGPYGLIDRSLRFSREARGATPYKVANGARYAVFRCPPRRRVKVNDHAMGHCRYRRISGGSLSACLQTGRWVKPKSQVLGVAWPDAETSD